jgi:LemA protein
MSSAAWITLGLAAVLTFWMVGAHNRLVALRNAIVAMFGPVDEQFRARQLLLREQGEAIATLSPGSAALLDALNAALSQADAACAHARTRPGAAGATTSLRLADEILDAARARLPADALGSPGLVEIQARLVATQASLDFTRRQFNDAVGEYNAAVRQFPTWIVAALFGFRPAGPI